MLTDFGIRLISRMSEPGTRSLARIVIAAAEKFPHIGRAFYEAGSLYGATRLAAELEHLLKSGAYCNKNRTERFGQQRFAVERV